MNYGIQSMLYPLMNFMRITKNAIKLLGIRERLQDKKKSLHLKGINCNLTVCKLVS